MAVECELFRDETKMTSIEKLISIGSGALASVPIKALPSPAGVSSARYEELSGALLQKNGFYAFESALHVIPAPAQTVNAGEIDLVRWNAPDLWRFEYEDLTDGLFFFAEDVFGVQFAIDGDRIVSFDPESGEIGFAADDIERWAEAILADYSQLTGYPVAHEWQEAHGALQCGKRLLPKVPFVLGGAFAPSNLVAVDAVEGMRYRGDLWRQIRDLPDGTQVQLKALPTH